MRHNVTTPGGFFVGVGGIAVTLAVASVIYAWVLKPAPNKEYLAQQKALGLAVSDELAKDANAAAAKQTEIANFLQAAGDKYNGGKKPDINNLEELRGVLRYREAQKSVNEALALLNAPSSVNGADGKPLPVLSAAIQAVAKDIAAKKSAASAVKIDILPPAQPINPPMPNTQGGGVHNVIFAEPKPAAPAPEAPKTSAIPATAPVVAAVPAPNRPPLLNWSDSK